MSYKVLNHFTLLLNRVEYKLTRMNGELYFWYFSGSYFVQIAKGPEAQEMFNEYLEAK